MSRQIRTEKAKRVRKGMRVIGLAAVLKSGAGAHKQWRDKRLSNARNDWRAEWE